MSPAERIGVVPFAPGLAAPADRRRIGCWARSRNRLLDVQTPHLQRIVVINPLADLEAWTAWRHASPDRRLIVDVVDYRYLLDALEPSATPSALARDLGRAWLYTTKRRSKPFGRFSTRLRMALEAADVITCSSPEHASYLAHFDLRGQPIIDCHEEIPLLSPRLATGQQNLRLLWEGQLATLPFVNELTSGLRSLADEAPVELVLCTDLKGHRYANRFGRISPLEILRPLHGVRGLSMSVQTWSPGSLADLAARADAAILPVDRDDGVAWLKAENRALIMWRLGLPVLMSATPAYQRMALAAGVEGLVRSPSEWGPALARARDGAWRSHQARLGHEFVLRSHGPEIVHAKWDEVFESL